MLKSSEVVEFCLSPYRICSDLYIIRIPGSAKVGDYAEVLREIRYLHKKPEDMNSRKFVVACSGANRQYTSNELVVQVNFAKVQCTPYFITMVQNLYTPLEQTVCVIHDVRVDDSWWVDESFNFQSGKYVNLS